MSRNRLLSGSAIIACIASISAQACAQAARDFDIPPGVLAESLNAFATQSNQQIFFAGDLVAGRRADGLRGRLVPSEALNRLLRGSGLTWSQPRDGVIYLRRAAESAQTGEAATDLEDVVVTGTLLKRSGDLASPVLVLDRDALDRRGAGTVAEAVIDLPQNYAGSGTPIVQMASSDRQGSNAVNATGVNLRGLGPASTLTLVNGRRLAGTGFRGEFGDISALPSGAVERVEILLDGASALYGADAVAGVVNVIMRRGFDGQETRARVSAARGGAEDVILSHLAGRSWSSGSAYLSWEYQNTNGLSSLDRPYTATGDLRAFGGTDHRVVYASPGNILGYDPAAGAYVAQYAIRPNASGAAQGPADFVAGVANLQSLTEGIDLLPDLERNSLYGRLRQGVGDRLELTADARYSRRDYAFEAGPGIGVFVVTAANPFFVSPAGAPAHILGYSFSEDLGRPRQSGRSESLGLTAGATYDLTSEWSLDAYVALAREKGDLSVRGRVHTGFLAEALGNAVDDPATAYRAAADGYFNPFGDGRANGRAVLDFIGSGYNEAHDRSRATSVNILAQGPVLHLPSGDLSLALGAQVREERFDTRTLSFISTASPSASVTPRAERRIGAVFAEARLPLVGPDQARPGLRSLEFSVAGRFEDYDDFGTTTNPKVGVVWSPASDLALRASWGTSFRAASLPQIHDASALSLTSLPRGDGTTVLALYQYGGNPDLKPETAETLTLGFDYRPRGRLTLSGNVFETDFTDRIAQPATENLAGVLTDPALAPFVTRVSPGTNAADLALVQSYISRPDFPFGSLYPATSYGAIVDGRWVNTGSVRVRGVDLSGALPLSLGRDGIVLDASASYILDYDSQTTPSAAVREVIGLIGYPVRLRSRLGGAWTRGDLGADLHWNHVAAYEDRLGVGIDAWNTVDLQMRWSPASGALTGIQLALSVQNLFDADPPFYDAPSGFGFDPGQASLLGRTVALQLIRRW
ncbi:TonB-dependent receptor domain-containing protein [Brevundimonas sp.]|uniref:TonB-dependent receptor domain-containing protein n=1 Tax=Brevundimonas sp. TaxID=1871086 RepID=UPI003BA9DF03